MIKGRSAQQGQQILYVIREISTSSEATQIVAINERISCQQQVLAFENTIYCKIPQYVRVGMKIYIDEFPEQAQILLSNQASECTQKLVIVFEPHIQVSSTAISTPNQQYQQPYLSRKKKQIIPMVSVLRKRPEQLRIGQLAHEECKRTILEMSQNSSQQAIYSQTLELMETMETTQACYTQNTNAFSDEDDDSQEMLDINRENIIPTISAKLMSIIQRICQTYNADSWELVQAEKGIKWNGLGGRPDAVIKLIKDEKATVVVLEYKTACYPRQNAIKLKYETQIKVNITMSRHYLNLETIGMLVYLKEQKNENAIVAVECSMDEEFDIIDRRNEIACFLSNASSYITRKEDINVVIDHYKELRNDKKGKKKQDYLLNDFSVAYSLEYIRKRDYVHWITPAATNTTVDEDGDALIKE